MEETAEYGEIYGLSLDDIIDVSTPTTDGTVTYLDERSESRFNLGCLSEGTACIRIGDPDILWRGLHRYELTYKLPLDDFIGSRSAAEAWWKSFAGMQSLRGGPMRSLKSQQRSPTPIG